MRLGNLKGGGLVREVVYLTLGLNRFTCGVSVKFFIN